VSEEGRHACEGEGRTGRRELRIDPLTHNTLQPQTQTQKRHTRKRQRIRPQRIAPIVRDARLPTLPYRQCRGHGEQRLDEGAEHEPRARFGAHFVAYAAEGCAEGERDEGGEGELVGIVEGGVALAWGA
jgi:hypothetical protein